MEIPRYATISGPRMLISLIPVDKRKDVPKKLTNRISDIIVRKSAMMTDSVSFEIPEGYQVEAVPSPVIIESKFGKYSLLTSVSEKLIIAVRTIEMTCGQYGPENHNDLVEFFRKMASADNSKASIKKIVL